MAYTVTITSHETYIDCTIDGAVSFENMLGIHHFLNLDQNFRNCRCALFDLRKVELLPTEGGKELMQLAMRMMNSHEINESAKIAFIAQDEDILEHGKIFGGIFEQSYLDIKTCSDENEAFDWFLGK